MTWERVSQISFELLICAIHPFPDEYHHNFLWTTRIGNHSSDGTKHKWVPLDIALSLPMFLRLYLVGRAMLLHRYET